MILFFFLWWRSYIFGKASVLVYGTRWWFITSSMLYIVPFVHALSASTTCSVLRDETRLPRSEMALCKNEFSGFRNLRSCYALEKHRKRRRLWRRRYFDITKDSRNLCEIQSTTLKRLQNRHPRRNYYEESGRVLYVVLFYYILLYITITILLEKSFWFTTGYTYQTV